MIFFICIIILISLYLIHDISQWNKILFLNSYVSSYYFSKKERLMNLSMSFLWISWKWFWFDNLNLNELYLDFSRFITRDFLCINQDIISFFLLCFFLPIAKEKINDQNVDLMMNVWYQQSWSDKYLKILI